MIKIPPSLIESAKNHMTRLLIILVVLMAGVGVFAYQKIVATSTATEQIVEEVDLAFDPEGPFALLYPRRDGNALILNLKRTAAYDAISYELAYVSQSEQDSASQSDESSELGSGGIDRGVMGTINAQEKRSEYEQEILFGTCSRNVCKYDKNVENGTLTLHIKKDSLAYRMVTQWRIQKPSVALGVLMSGDSHFTYTLDSKSPDMDLVSFIIVNDLTGAPKLSAGKQIIGKVYAVNPPEAKQLGGGEVKIEMADNPPADSKIALYKESENKWVEFETKVTGSTLTANVDGSGIITVLAPK